MNTTPVKQTEQQKRPLDDVEKALNIQGLSNKEVSALLNLNEHIAFKGFTNILICIFLISVNIRIYLKIKKKEKTPKQ